MFRLPPITPAFILIFIVSCTAPTLPPAQTASPTIIYTATFLPTNTPTPSPTSTPTPTSTSTITPTITSTVTITASPKVEAIRNAVGDKPEDWFRQVEEGVYEVKMIWPGHAAFNKEPIDLKNNKGEVMGKILTSFVGEYLIGNQIRQIIVPIYWQDFTRPGICYFFLMDFKCEFLLPGDMTDKNLERFVRKPGQVVIMYVHGPAQTEPVGEWEFTTGKTTRIYYTGIEDLLRNFLEYGDPSLQVFIPGSAKTGHCKPEEEKKYPYYCQEKTYIFIPGYQ